MITKARVVSVNGDVATVVAKRTSACEGCHKSAEGCSVCSLMGEGGEITAEAENAVGARVGDTVEIESESKRVLFYGAAVFLFPIVMMLAGYWITSCFTESEIWRCVAATVAVVLSFCVVWCYSRSVGKRGTDIKIVRILSEE